MGPRRHLPVDARQPDVQHPRRTSRGALNVQQRNVDFNTVLRRCARSTSTATTTAARPTPLEFASSDVSTLDYFHPNTNGQAKAAATAWANGPNFADLTAPATTITRDHAAAGVDDWYRRTSR